VVTNALNIAMILSRNSEIEVICTGGTVHGSYYSLTGPVAEQALRNHYFDIAVIGVSGITVREGLTVNSQLNAFTMRIMSEQAQKTMIVADHTKFGRVRFAHLAPLSTAHWLIVDRSPPDKIRRELEEGGVDLVVASELVK
jgi:DeoR/GlpR family transcriptional regulator of sugar metabolism